MQIFDDITVVPDYPSNHDLARRISEELSQFVDVRSYDGRKPPPKILIFRPTGRPADEFAEAVTPILDKLDSGVKVYLVVAFSGQYKNISELVPYGLRDKVIMKEVIYIQSGHLVPQSSHYFTTNREAFQNLATDIANAYGLSIAEESVSSEPKKARAREWLSEKAGAVSTFFSSKSHKGSSEIQKQSNEDGLSFEYTLARTEAELVGRAVLILQDFPSGISQDELFTLLQLDAAKKEKLEHVLNFAGSVFTTDVRCGKTLVKIAEPLKKCVSEIKQEEYFASLHNRYKVRETSSDEAINTCKAEKHFISSEDAAAFLEKLKDLPHLLDTRVIELVEDEFNIKGQLVDTLKKVLEEYRQTAGAAAVSTDKNIQSASINCDLFVKLMESGRLQLTDELASRLQKEFGLSSEEITDGLKRVYLKLT